MKREKRCAPIWEPKLWRTIGTLLGSKLKPRTQGNEVVASLTSSITLHNILSRAIFCKLPNLNYPYDRFFCHLYSVKNNPGFQRPPAGGGAVTAGRGNTPNGGVAGIGGSANANGRISRGRIPQNVPFATNMNDNTYNNQPKIATNNTRLARFWAMKHPQNEKIRGLKRRTSRRWCARVCSQQ